MSIYLSELQAYDPQEFGDDVQSLIKDAIKEAPLKDLFYSESSFYDNLIQEIKDILYNFCEAIADEAYDTGVDSGYESASEDFYSEDYVSGLNEEISCLRYEVSGKEEQIEELQAELDECRQSQTPELDIDEIRDAIKADLIAEMTPDDSNYED